LIVHAGDFTAAEVFEELTAIAPVAAVHGNMDVPALRERLPARVVVEAEGTRIGVVHDGGPSVGRHERLAQWFPGCDLVVYGHSHLPELARQGEIWIVNPGSPTERRRAPSHTLAVVRGGVPRLVNLDEQV
jgi:uncharacterized protein